MNDVATRQEMKLPVDCSECSIAQRKVVREEYIRRQEGKCYFCNAPLTGRPPKGVTDKPIRWELFPPQFLRWPVHLHHSHDTGMTIGAVHSYCNAVLWQYHGE